MNHLVKPLATRIANMVARALVKNVDDSLKVQILQLGVLADETREGVERIQNYGFTSVPLEGAEAVLLSVGGRRDHGLVIAVDDRRYRLKALENGEVAMYDQTGSKIVMKANGDIQLVPSSGKVALTGDLDVSGTVTATTDVVGGGKHLKTHTHAGNSLTTASSCTAGGATGTVAGNTAGPN
jgi:phage gp45-like